jgi:FkbM family methyltransferase
MPSVVRNMTRLLSTRGMPIAYSRWLWSLMVRGEAPPVPCANTNIGGWVNFSDYWCFHKGIPRAQRRLIENCLRTTASPRPVAIDIGANLGLFTAELAGRGFPEVHSFEPAPKTFAKLKLNIEASPCTRRTVMLNRIAVGPRNGVADLQLDPESPATNHVYLEGAERECPVQRVPMTTLDRYCDENGIEQIDFLKIDTEGFEPYVLEGAQHCLRNGRIPMILLEVCPSLLERAGSSVTALYDRLLGSGYWPHELKSNGQPGGALSVKRLEKIRLDDIVAVPYP